MHFMTLMKHPPTTKPPFPSKDDLLAFIGKAPGKIGTREIARACGLKSADRAALKRVLRELADQGAIERRRKKLHQPGRLPHVVLTDITARDTDGELIALPTEWDEAEHGPAPKIRVRIPRRARPSEIAGVGDRALLRIEESREKEDAIRYSGRVIKLIDRGRERAIPPGAGGDARDGDLVAVEVAARRSGFGLPNARVTERLGSLATERAVSLIAIHAHSIPHVFPAAVLAEAAAGQPPRAFRPGGW